MTERWMLGFIGTTRRRRYAECFYKYLWDFAFGLCHCHRNYLSFGNDIRSFSFCVEIPVQILYNRDRSDYNIGMDDIYSVIRR